MLLVDLHRTFGVHFLQPVEVATLEDAVLNVHDTKRSSSSVNDLELVDSHAALGGAVFGTGAFFVLSFRNRRSALSRSRCTRSAFSAFSAARRSRPSWLRSSSLTRNRSIPGT